MKELKLQYKKSLGRTKDGIHLYEVNGPEVRYHDVDFALGAHWLVKDYIPKGEGWIERVADPIDQCATTGHEVDEIRLMRDLKMPYDPAHAKASEKEEKSRKSKSCNIEDLFDVKVPPFRGGGAF